MPSPTCASPSTRRARVDPIGGSRLDAAACGRSREDAVVIDASTTCKSPDILTPGSFSWHVLSSLTDEVRTFQDGRGPEEGRVFGISMTARRASSLR
jgi:hypothetical protein